MVTFGVKWTLVDHPDHATARYYMLDSIPLDRPVRALTDRICDLNSFSFTARFGPVSGSDTGTN